VTLTLSSPTMPKNFSLEEFLSAICDFQITKCRTGRRLAYVHSVIRRVGMRRVYRAHGGRRDASWKV